MLHEKKIYFIVDQGAIYLESKISLMIFKAVLLYLYIYIYFKGIFMTFEFNYNCIKYIN